MKFADFSEMPVWKRAFEIILSIYKTTKQFPSEEKFGIVQDMRRAANSIAHNIAEGFGRFESKDKTRFYKISRGSVYELMSQVLVSEALGYIQDPQNKNNIISSCETVIDELNSLIKTLETSKLQSAFK